jgi:hypothetical protein
MLRTLVSTLAGMLVGVGLTAGLLRLTWSVVGGIKSPRVFEVEPSVIYQTVVLGAGFGSVCGALVGLAGVIARVLRDRPPSG